MRLSRTAFAFSAFSLIAAAPAPSPDAKLRAIIAPVSQQQLRHTIESLVSFGTQFIIRRIGSCLILLSRILLGVLPLLFLRLKLFL